MYGAYLWYKLEKPEEVQQEACFIGDKEVEENTRVSWHDCHELLEAEGRICVQQGLDKNIWHYYTKIFDTIVTSCVQQGLGINTYLYLDNSALKCKSWSFIHKK